MRADTDRRRLIRKTGSGLPWHCLAFSALLTCSGGIYLLAVGRLAGIFALLLAITFGAVALARFRIREP
jgi:hypothetical protein